MSENTTYSDSEYDDDNDTGGENTSKEKKKRPLKTDKMPLKEAVKTAQERSYYLIIECD